MTNISSKHILIICGLLISFAADAQKQLLDKVIARVGSEYISLSDIEEDYIYRKSGDPSMDESAKCQILQEAIAQKVIIYQAKLDSIEVTDAEVETQLDLRFESVLRQMNGDEVFFKEYYGATVNEMKDRYRDDQRQKILAEKMQYQLIQEVDITPEEVLTFFNNIPRDSLPYLNSEVEISEIMIEPEVNSIERNKALVKAEEIYALLLEGGDFAELALKNSDDKESAKRGGDLGFARRGTYVPEFEAAVFSLEPNEISEIVETQFGFHIIQLIKRRGNSVNARHILISPLVTVADEIKAKEKLDSIRTLLVADSLSFELAVKRFSIKDLPSYSNNGKVKNPATGTNFFETKDLDPDTYFAIDNLDVNDVSEVLEVKSFRGDKMYRLVKLQSKSRPHRANLEEDYDKISYFAKESKKSQYYVKWLDEKLNNTYIKIDPMYQDCIDLKKWIDQGEN